MEREVICPKCKHKGLESSYECAVRQGEAIIYGIKVWETNMGFKCKCGHEFGFE